MIVTTAAEVMRDSDDPEIRADMFHVLRQLKVTYESCHFVGGAPPH